MADDDKVYEEPRTIRESGVPIHEVDDEELEPVEDEQGGATDVAAGTESFGASPPAPTGRFRR